MNILPRKITKTFKGAAELHKGVAKYERIGYTVEQATTDGKEHFKIGRGLIFLPLGFTGRKEKHVVTFVKKSS